MAVQMTMHNVNKDFRKYNHKFLNYYRKIYENMIVLHIMCN